MELKQLFNAKDRLAPFLLPTPLIYSQFLKKELGKNVWLKLETQNPTGSFKPRPAFNSILSHLDEAKRRGVIASSSGNFAQGVAYAAVQLGVSALIVMTESTSVYKINRTKKLGAEVVLSGDSHEARLELTNQLQHETKRLMLHPYDSLETIAGDGTIALELHEQLKTTLDDKTCVLVPVSGGGLIAGIAFGLKSLHPTCKVIGVQSEVSGTLAKSLKAGKNIHVGKFKTIADALVASTLGDIPFEIIKNYVDGAVLISEEQIKKTTHYLLEHHKLVVEPAAALPVAVVFENKLPYDHIICIVTGGNLDLAKFLKN